MGFDASTRWHYLLDAAELIADQVCAAEFQAQRLVLWRDESGELVVQEGLCPHLGADLGFNGLIENGVLACRFHGWCWHASGENAGVPYSKAFPKLDLHRYLAKEEDGKLWLAVPLQRL